MSSSVRTLSALCLNTIVDNIEIFDDGISDFILKDCVYVLTELDALLIPNVIRNDILGVVVEKNKLTVNNFLLLLNENLRTLHLTSMSGKVNDNLLVI